jgi:hypothetical protein
MTTATLNGTANPNGLETLANFEYGLTDAYGSTTPVQDLGSGTSDVAIPGGTVTGLLCNTLYHFRATATSSAGTSDGADVTFTTAPCAAARCPRTAEYWEDHPNAWLVTELTLGQQTYRKRELLSILRQPVDRDASLILARQLIAAKLNIADGSDPAAIATTLQAADSLLNGFDGPLPYQVKPRSETGAEMRAAAAVLNSYNHRLLTPGCTE